MAKELVLSETEKMLASLTDTSNYFDNVKAEDIAIPYIYILQDNSKAVKSGPGKVEGAKAGLLFNNVTGELYDSIKVVPVSWMEDRYIEWTPGSRGQFVGSYVGAEAVAVKAASKEVVDDEGKRRVVTASGNWLVQTHVRYVLVLKGEGESLRIERAVIAMAKTQIKHSKRWNNLILSNTMMTSTGPKVKPPFSRVYTLSTALESKNDDTWFSWNIGSYEEVKDLWLVQEALAFNKAVGTVTFNMHEEHEEASSITPTEVF